MIKIGQIGIGHNHGAAKMEAVRKFPQLFTVVGYAEENDTWIEKRGHLKAYEGLPRLSVDEIIQQCDAILIETDVWDLSKFALRCVEAGKHIHMDKPAGGSLEQFGQVLDIAKAKNLVVQMGYMYRYNPAVLKCLELMDAGKLGQIHTINAEMSAYDPIHYKQWLTQFPGAGMYIFGCHLVDLVVRILGKPEKVHSFMKHTGADNVGLPDVTLAVLEYPKALAKIYNSSVEVNGWGRRQLMVAGTKGTVNIMPLESPCHMTYSDLEIADWYHDDKKNAIEVEDIPKNCRYDSMVQDFYAYIKGTKENPYTYDHDYAVQEVLLQIVGDGK